MVLQAVTALLCLLALAGCGENAPSPPSPVGGAPPADPPPSPSPPSAGPPESGPAGEELTLDDTRLRLDSPGCVLSSRRGGHARSARLGLPPPCRFATTRDARPRIVQTARGKVVLVESSRHATPPECDTVLQAVLVDADGMRVSHDTQAVTACPPFEWDEMMYQTFRFDGPAM